jgi:DNA-directed RNA polymerase specialized sigma24 family protein
VDAVAPGRTAFAILYERRRASVLAVGIGALGSRDDAEDAAREAFAALAPALADQPPRELRAWLIRVTRNRAIDHVAPGAFAPGTPSR